MKPTSPAIPAEPTMDMDPPGRRRTVVAIAIGNLLEWYDFAVYASLAAILGKLFFPADDGIVSVLATFSVFAVGYLARPLGGAVFGRMADRRGRKRTLVIVILLMGFSTVLIGILPTHASIGVLAPVLLVGARLLQGLSVGGEFSSSTSFLVEIAPAGRRGLYGSVTYFTACLGFALGLAFVFALQLALPKGALEEWAWRVPFLLGLPLLLIGAYLRKRTQETPLFRSLSEAGDVESAPLRALFRVEWRTMTRMLGMALGFALSSYTVLAFVLTYLLVIRKESTNSAYASVLVATVVGACASPAFGALSDRVGRRPMLLAACVAQVVLAVPSYLLMAAGGFGSTTAGQLLLWLPVAIFCGVMPTAYSEMYPTMVRSTGVGLANGVATAVFSGTAPLVSTFLIAQTQNVIAPAWYLVFGGVVSGLVILGLRETAHVELRAS